MIDYRAPSCTSTTAPLRILLGHLSMWIPGFSVSGVFGVLIWVLSLFLGISLFFPLRGFKRFFRFFSRNFGVRQGQNQVVADVWKNDVWDFQAKSGSSGSCRLFLHFLGSAVTQRGRERKGGPRNHPEISSQKLANFECRFPEDPCGRDRASF